MTRSPEPLQAALRLTPHGRLLLEGSDEAASLDAGLGQCLREAFAKGSGEGLWRLATVKTDDALPPVLNWWRGFALQFVAAIRQQPPNLERLTGKAGKLDIDPPTPAELTALIATAPLMAGAEYLGQETLCSLWKAIEAAFVRAYFAAGKDLQGFLSQHNPAWTLAGRVHFNLAENRRDPEFPFAFMATYTTVSPAAAKPQHLPLGEALREYAGAKNKSKLLSLLLPLQRGAEKCRWLKELVDTGDIFHPLRWSLQQALELIRSGSDLQQAGIITRMPPAWRAGRPPRPKATATIGQREPSTLGIEGLLDFKVQVTLEGDRLTEAEFRSLVAGTDGLVLLRGQWVEVDRTRLDAAMTQFSAAETLATREGLSFGEAMRMLSGAQLTTDKTKEANRACPKVV